MSDATRQMNSPSYLLPAEDIDFMLNRREMRGLRFAMEYSKADLLLRDWHIRSTIICFGSARTPSPEQVAALEAVAEHGDAPSKEKAIRAKKLSVYYEAARAFGRLVSERGGALNPVDGWRDNVIATGGGPGIMEAANRGATEAGAPTIGFNITLAHEQEPNAYTTPELTFRFHYFAMRKMHLAMRARALAVFPGGFGTMDELFEILTLQQTGKAKLAPVVLVGRDYWERIFNFEVMLEYGVISPPDLNLIEIVDTAEEAWESLLKRGLQVPARL